MHYYTKRMILIIISKVYGLFINNGVNLVNLSEAQKICNNLDIKLYEKDLDTNYKDELSKFITSELNIGVIPDIELIYNKLVLIGMLKEVAKEKHIKYISTGLFAQVQDNKLINAIDSSHDETYKLSRISEEEIKKLVLPIGEIDNIQVERMAENNNIKSSISNTTIVEKLGEGNIRDILSKVIVNEPGNIVDIGTNQTIGNHDGIINYIIRIMNDPNALMIDGKYTIIGFDKERNIINVAYENDINNVSTEECILESVNIIKPTDGNSYTVLSTVTQ